MLFLLVISPTVFIFLPIAFLKILRFSRIAFNNVLSFLVVSDFRQIRRRVGSEVASRLVLALMMSRLDYCNSVLSGLPLASVAPLQRAQIAAARQIFELGSRDLVTSSILQLHWLPRS